MKFYNLGQDELKYIYDSAKARAKNNLELTGKYKSMIEQHVSCKSKDEAVEAARSMLKSGRRGCQVWAAIGIDEEYFFIQDYYIVTDDIHLCVAAEYVGMAQLYID
jgi:hypothetical protein